MISLNYISIVNQIYVHKETKILSWYDVMEMQFEWNARTQITMWFDNTEEEASLLRDYGMTNWWCLI